MRVSLLYNPTAGDAAAPHPLPSMLARHGHQVVTLVDDRRQAEKRLLAESCDLVVAAGGDGTVGLAARILADRGVPLAILPIGNANNIALTLGIGGSPDELISGWNRAREQPVDLGRTEASWGSQLFVESLGTGLMAAGIAEAASTSFEQLAPPLSSLTRTAQVYRTALDNLQPRRCTVSVDGNHLEDDFLLVEILNMRFIGPNLVFAPDADPSDGLFSIAVARSHERRAIDDYLRHRLEGTDCPLSLTRYRGRRVELDNAGSLHIDDAVPEIDAGTHLSITLSPGALTVLI